MGELKGHSLEDMNRQEVGRIRAGRGADHPRLRRDRSAADAGGDSQPGGSLHGLRHPVLPRRGLPGRQLDPGHERVRVQGPVGAGLPDPARDQQFPGDYRTHLPGALRDGLHAGRQRQPGPDQAHRVPDRRAGVPGRLDQAAAGGQEDRQTGRDRRLRPCGTGGGAAVGPGRAQRRGLREGRAGRRHAPLRDSRLQARQARHRPAARAAQSRRRRVPDRRQRRQGHLRPVPAEDVRLHLPDDGRPPASRHHRARAGRRATSCSPWTT